MILVVDASVALKWFFRTRQDEPDANRALDLLAGVDAGRIDLVQPPHFHAEVASVLAREKPGEAQDDLLDLLNIECELVQDAEVYATAIDLATRLQHHLFDTLYHAVALHVPHARLVTADRRYFDKAAGIGRVVWLADLAA